MAIHIERGLSTVITKPYYEIG